MKWISVKERMPEISTPYDTFLVWKKPLNGELAYGVGEVEQWSRDKKTFSNRGFFNYCDITHWQPLPDPPKGE